MDSNRLKGRSQNVVVNGRSSLSGFVSKSRPDAIYPFLFGAWEATRRRLGACTYKCLVGAVRAEGQDTSLKPSDRDHWWNWTRARGRLVWPNGGCFHSSPSEEVGIANGAAEKWPDSSALRGAKGAGASACLPTRALRPLLLQARTNPRAAIQIIVTRPAGCFPPDSGILPPIAAASFLT